MNLYYELTTGVSPGPLPDYLDMSDAEVLRLLQVRFVIGLWRADLETGHFFGSQEASNLFGLPHTDGPVSVVAASATMHPEDASVALELLETVAREKGSGQIVLRVRRNGSEGYKYVRIVGRYRAGNHGLGEIIGICHEVTADD